MKACGLELVGDQMKLLEVLDSLESDISFKNLQPKKIDKTINKKHRQRITQANIQCKVSLIFLLLCKFTMKPSSEVRLKKEHPNVNPEWIKLM